MGVLVALWVLFTVGIGPVAGLAQQVSEALAARGWVEAHLSVLGLDPEDVAEMVVSSQSASQAAGVTHVYFQQRIGGIDIFRGVLGVHLDDSGAVLSTSNRFVASAAGKVQANEPILSAQEAAERGASAVGLVPIESLELLAGPNGPSHTSVLSSGGIASHTIEARLVYLPLTSAELALAWSLRFEPLDSNHAWALQIDALDGEVLEVIDRVVRDDFGPLSGGPKTRELDDSSTPSESSSAKTQAVAAVGGDGARYEVFAIPTEHPGDGPREIVESPADPVASPFGWHDTDGASGPEFTSTSGNNADAYADRDDDGVADPGSVPSGGSILDFTGSTVPYHPADQPDQFIHASVTNLFYWTNLLHDITYRYGFDEQSGNFQVNNYGNGGLGGDPVKAEAQDAADAGERNNANFLADPDGIPGRIQMYLWYEASPERDGDLANDIIAHEYGHGVSIRLVGGPATDQCLQNDEQMGEGWSDLLALLVTGRSTDTPLTWRGIGTWVTDQDPVTGTGVRPAPYTSDLAVNGYTYADLPTLAVPHGVGFMWASMLWDLHWLLVEDHGFNPEISDDWTTGGNNLLLQLVLDAMKLTPCNPGFVEARNALLLADTMLTTGQNQCRIWEAAARRGLGFNALQGSSGSADDGTPDFEVAPACDLVEVTPEAAAICAGDVVVFDVDVGSAFSGSVTLSASGQPPGSTVMFQPPLVVAPGGATMTISNTDDPPLSHFDVEVEGTDGTRVDGDSVALTIHDGLASPPAMLFPVDGAVNVSRTPVLSWEATDVKAVVVEIDDDPLFGSVDRTATLTPPFVSWTVSPPLEPETFYFWRTRAETACGFGPPGVARKFLTEVAVCSSPMLMIPDDDSGGVSDTIALSLLGSVSDLDVVLRVLHGATGDLVISLEHLDTTTSNTLLDQPISYSGNSCLGNDIDALFDDSAIGDAQTSCDGTPPSLESAVRPLELLSVFDGEANAGTWRLTVADVKPVDTGVLTEWCLLPRSTPGFGAELAASKSVTGFFAAGGEVRYTIELSNSGTVDQSDNPGHELVDQLPPELLGFSAIASSGAVVLDPVSGTVTWNGTVAVGGLITITVDAVINSATAPGTILSNQATLGFDSNGNGTNESLGVSDDPSLPGDSDTTEFVVGLPNVVEVPTLSGWNAAWLAILLAGLAARKLRRRWT
jgi:hypothetical protein